MPVDRKSANHICNVIRRQVQEEYPELTLMFVLHDENKRAQAISKASAQLQDHPAGEKFIHFFGQEKRTGEKDKKSYFAGLAIHQNPGFLNFFKSYNVLGLFCLNYDRFDSEDDLRNHAYHMVWHALSLYDDIKAKSQKESKPPVSAPHKEQTVTTETVDEIILPALHSHALCHRNLTADIFSASIQTIMKKENAIRNLARQRMAETLRPQTGLVAEKFPFPISVETLGFLFSESMKNTARNGKALFQAIQITKEIGKTYSFQNIKQWRSFSQPAQEMAWAGFDPETILGAAIYTSENTFIRSIADMVAENMDITPALITSLNAYNPFTEQEVNERLHAKICKEKIKEVFTKIRTPDDRKIFLHEAHEQNENLISGNPIGWCAYPLLCASEHIKNATIDSISHAKEEAQAVFFDKLAEINWECIRALTRTLFLHRRDGYKITSDNVITLCSKKKEYKAFEAALKMIQAEKDFLNALDPIEQKQDDTQNIPRFIN